MASNPSPAESDSDGLSLRTNRFPIHPLSAGEDNPAAADGSAAEEDVAEKVIESNAEEADMQAVVDGGYTEKSDSAVEGKEETTVSGFALDVEKAEATAKVGVDGDLAEDGNSILEESVNAGAIDANLGLISAEVQGKDSFQSVQSQKLQPQVFENQERTDDVVRRGRGRPRKNPDDSQQKSQSKHDLAVSGCSIKTRRKRGRAYKNLDSEGDCEKATSVNSVKQSRLDKEADPKTGKQFAAHSMTSSVGDYASLDANKMLSQLRLLSTDQNEGRRYLPVVREFFTQVRASLWKHKKPEERKNRKRKLVNFEPNVINPDHATGSCLSGVGLESRPETESMASRTRKRIGASKKNEENKRGAKHAPGKPSPFAPPDSSLCTERPNEIKEESPTAMILTFSDSGAIPTASDLIELFSTFGPIIEEETEVLIKEDRARVVFRYHDDAQKAYNSAGNYRVFGAASVSYRLSNSFLPKSSLAAIPEEKNNNHTTQGTVYCLRFF